jgi:hypothetical protein
MRQHRGRRRHRADGDGAASTNCGRRNGSSGVRRGCGGVRLGSCHLIHCCISERRRRRHPSDSMRAGDTCSGDCGGRDSRGRNRGGSEWGSETTKMAEHARRRWTQGERHRCEWFQPLCWIVRQCARTQRKKLRNLPLSLASSHGCTYSTGAPTAIAYAASTRTAMACAAPRVCFTPTLVPPRW